MTLAAAIPLQRWEGNGGTAAFVFADQVFALEDLNVELCDDNQVRQVIVSGGAGTYDYVVTGNLNTLTQRYQAVTITFNTAPPSGWTVGVLRETPQTQTTDLFSGQSVSPEALETRLDRVVAIVQDLRARDKLSPEAGIACSLAIDAMGASIKNVGATVDDNDVVTKAYLDVTGTTPISGTTAPVVANSVALAAVTGATEAFSLGYLAAGDGGGGLYRLDGASTDPIAGARTVNASGGGRWNRIRLGSDDVVSLEDFGVIDAADNPTADNQSLIQAAINALPAHGGTVLVPESVGGFGVGSASVVLNDNITICGMGPLSKVFMLPGTDAGIFAVAANNFEIRDLELVGSYVEGVYEPNSTAYGVLLNPPSPGGMIMENFRITNVTFRSFLGRALTTSGGDPFEGVIGGVVHGSVTRCRFIDNRRNGINFFKGADDWTIAGCTFLRNGVAVGSDDATMSDPGPETTAPCDGVRIAFCFFKDNGGSNIGPGEASGVNCSGAKRWTVLGCTFDTGGQQFAETAMPHLLFNDGQEFYNVSSDVVIEACTFARGTSESITLTAVKRASIRGCHFEDNFIRATPPSPGSAEIIVKANTDSPVLGCDLVIIEGNTASSTAATSRTDALVDNQNAENTNIVSRDNVLGAGIAPFVRNTSIYVADGAASTGNSFTHGNTVREIIADDAVSADQIAFDAPHSLLTVWTASGEYAVLLCDAATGAAVIMTQGPGGNIEEDVNGSKPGGGAGADNKLTVFMDNASFGRCWLSNRLGVSAAESTIFYSVVGVS